MGKRLKEGIKPYYLQIREYLLEELKKKKDFRIPSENQLCEYYGVSRPTVRKALEYLVEQNLIVRKQGKGSFVKRDFEKEILTQERSLVVILPEGWHLTNSENYLSRIMEGFFSVSKKKKIDLKIINFSSLNFFTKLKELDTNLTLWISPEREEVNVMEELANRNYTIVALNRKINNQRINYISCDHLKGGYIATEYLLSNGHKRIGFVGIVDKFSFLRERYKGYLLAHHRHNFLPDISLVVYTSFKKEEIKKDVEKLLKKKEFPTALFLASGDFQEAVLEVLEDMNLRIPEDISIVSFDEVAGISEENSLTVVEQPLKKMGQISAEMLTKYEVNKNHKRFKILLEPRLIIRKSVKQV